MITRKALITDIPALNRIAWKAKGYWGYPDEWMNVWKKDLSTGKKDLTGMNIILAEQLHEINGFGALKENPTYDEIVHLWVLPANIGTGVGKILLDNLLSNVVDKPIKVVSDPNATGFYEKNGFIITGKTESYPKGRFLPVLEKVINPTSKR